MDDQGQVKSGSSRLESYVRFINRTNRNVDIIWLNYEGQRVKYRTLIPQQYFDVNTYVSHPWIFRDSSSNAKLLASSQEIFQPKFWLKMVPPDQRNERMQPRRTIINITLPMYSLKERCLEVVRQCLNSLDDANSLCIPRTLQQELRQPDV